MSILIKERLIIEKNLSDKANEKENFYKRLLIEVNILISKFRNLLFNLLKGRVNYDVTDALGALMVLDIKQAKNVLYHSSVYSNISRQISFQTLLDDVLVTNERNAMIPYLTKKGESGFFEISFMDKDIIEKDLHETHFLGHDYLPNYTLKHGTIEDYHILGKRLLRFVKHFDWSITKHDLTILYTTLTQIGKEKTTPLEIDLVRNKINNIFSRNRQANRKLCVLITLSRVYKSIFSNNIGCEKY